MDKLEKYRKENPKQKDIFHEVPDVKVNDKQKIRLAPGHRHYNAFRDKWFTVQNSDDNGYYATSDSVMIYIPKEHCQTYHEYIKQFRDNSKLNRDYKPVNNSRFNWLVEQRIDKIRKSLVTKGQEYSGNGREDRMHNFVEAAKMNNTTPERALHGFLTKHLVSYQDILNDIDKGIIPSKELINEKFGDIINYFILQEIQLLNRLED